MRKVPLAHEKAGPSSEWSCINRRPEIWIFTPSDSRQTTSAWVGLVWQTYRELNGWSWALPGKASGIVHSREAAMEATSHAWAKVH